MAGRFDSLLNPDVIKVIVGVVVVGTLVVLLTTSGRDVALPKPTPAPTDAFEQQIGKPNPGFHPDKASDYIDNLARTTHGDWSKISADDQKYVDSVTSGHGAIYIRDRAKFLLATPSPSPHPSPSPKKVSPKASS